MPEVSVILAARNQARWLDATVRSVREQTFADWELLVVDDGSTDDSAAVIHRHRDDRRILWLPGPHTERAAARNRGIAAAQGSLIAFLDGDDLWQPHKLERQVTVLRQHPAAALCYTVARVVDGSSQPSSECKPKRPLGSDPFASLARGNVLILSSVMVRRDPLRAVGGFDETLPVFGCEDWDLWLRLSRRWPVAGIGEELVWYRRHEANTPRAQVLASALAVIERLWADPATARRAQISRASVRALHLWWHAAALARHAPRLAVTYARQALAEAPRTLLSRPALHTVLAMARRAF